ncbi:MAG: glycosyltransferase [Bdellovibrionales bacterium]|nr:glycosyltransferase [Bdellovibrionales bacterium]
MNSDRKISIFLPSLRGGGAERAMILFAQGAIQAGYKVDLLLSEKSGPLETLVDPAVCVISFQQPRVARSLPALVGYLKREQPLALYSTIPHANCISILAGLLSRTPFQASSKRTRIIVRESNSPVSETKASFSRKITHWLTPYLYPLADNIIAVSNGVRDEIGRISPRSLRKTTVCHTPVYLPHFEELAQEACPHAWLSHKSIPVYLGIGRLTPQKNFSLLLKAFTSIRRKHPARLIILGEGALRKKLIEQADALGIADDISLPGFALNPFPYLKRADCFVLSSDFEGMPNVLIQALTMGTKVVATDCPSGPRECLGEGNYGRLVPVGDKNALADAMEQVLNDEPNPKIAAIMKERYGVPATTAAYLKLAGLE